MAELWLGTAWNHAVFTEPSAFAVIAKCMRCVTEAHGTSDGEKFVQPTV
jgi:hypothetical protein